MKRCNCLETSLLQMEYEGLVKLVLPWVYMGLVFHVQPVR